MGIKRLLIALATLVPVALLAAPDDKPPKPAAAAPAAEEYDKLGAFEVVRWKEDPAAGPEVELGGIKYELKELQDFPVAKVIAFCKKNYPKDWRKAFEEDLIEVLSKLGKPPEGTVKVKVKPAEGGEERTFEAVWLTEANLESIIKNRQIVVAGAGVGAVPAAAAGDVKRVERQHAAAVAEPFKHLTRRLVPRSAEGKDVLTRMQAEEDLDELEWYLVNRYAYLGRNTFDYKAALDAVRAGLGEAGIARGAFALQLHQLQAMFGDADTGVMLDLQADLPEGYLPFLLAEVAGGKIVAYDPGGAGLVDLDRPVLSKLDGVEVAKWLEAAGRIAPGGSPQAVRRQSVENLRYVNFIRNQLDLQPKDTLSVELASPDGKDSHAIEMKLAAEPVRPPRPREGLRRTLEGNVGYLRLAAAADDPNFIKAMNDAMAESRGTDGLVIDVRCGGGRGRAALRFLFPYFMDADEKPLVANVAAYRLNEAKNEVADAKEGYLEERLLFPASSMRFGEDERAAIAKFAKGFDPEWRPPGLGFSAWHCMVLSPLKGEHYYRYDKPVVVLTDAGSSGAADVLAGAFKGRKNVTLMGTATAGATGRSEAVRLVNSGIAVRVCTTASYRPDGKLYDGRGVDPDVEVGPAPDDFIGRTDSVLEAARKKAKGQ